MVCLEEEAQPKALLGGVGVSTYATVTIITCHYLQQINIKRFLGFFCSATKDNNDEPRLLVIFLC
jgi:hypothetical protein